MVLVLIDRDHPAANPGYPLWLVPRTFIDSARDGSPALLRQIAPRPCVDLGQQPTHADPSQPAGFSPREPVRYPGERRVELLQPLHDVYACRGHASARYRRTEFEPPPLRKSGQRARQLVQPGLHAVTEAGGEALPGRPVDTGNGRTHGPTVTRGPDVVVPYLGQRADQRGGSGRNSEDRGLPGGRLVWRAARGRWCGARPATRPAGVIDCVPGVWTWRTRRGRSASPKRRRRFPGGCGCVRSRDPAAGVRGG
jgi:hypothetical protein